MTDFEAQLIDAIPDLRRASRALTGSRDMADDLVQATLERALLKQDLYEPTGAFVGWLTMIMRRLFIDDFRKKRPVLVDNARSFPIGAGRRRGPIRSRPAS
ncbi:MAG: RNA polymerase sigma factor [Pseudomonadota bacterium]